MEAIQLSARLSTLAPARALGRQLTELAAAAPWDGYSTTRILSDTLRALRDGCAFCPGLHDAHLRCHAKMVRALLYSIRHEAPRPATGKSGGPQTDPAQRAPKPRPCGTGTSRIKTQVTPAALIGA